MNAPDSTLDRLNYFNGQRLEAADFRTEQAYHIAVRRALNRALYRPGIASGLEVRKTADPSKVLVLPGLAIDAQGREIILLDSREILARGSPSGPGGLVIGNYLVISYYEAKAGASEDGCHIDTGASLCNTGRAGCSCGCPGGTCACSCGHCKGDPTDAALTWSGMTRIRAEPILDFLNTWPTKASGKIVLAQLNLDAQCRVVDVLTGVRQYASGTQAPKARPLSLEGEKDIDRSNPKVLFFQVEGSNPQRVTLHLWTMKFSSLYYTEMGKHHHVVNGTTDNFVHDLTHKHGITNGKTDGAGAHMHNYLCDARPDATNRDLHVFAVTPPPPGIILFDAAFHAGDQAAGFTGEPGIKTAPDHTHTLALDNALGLVGHTHGVNITTQDTGVTTVSARNGQPPLGYIDALKVELDGADITTLILNHLNGLSPGDWTKLGDGTATHALASAKGTGGIELKQLGIEMPLGAHKLVFSVPANVGGQLHYNLYVE
jgi:hypothetical protein